MNRFAEEKWKNRFTTAAKENYNEMGLLTFSVVFYTPKNGQQAVDMYVYSSCSGVIHSSHTGITLYRTIRFKERIQCIGPSEFARPRESVNVIPNWEECITGNYWAYYTHRVALGDAAHDAGTKLLPRKCRISTMPVSIGMSENPGNRICAIFLPPQYSC